MSLRIGKSTRVARRTSTGNALVLLQGAESRQTHGKMTRNIRRKIITTEKGK